MATLRAGLCKVPDIRLKILTVYDGILKSLAFLNRENAYRVHVEKIFCEKSKLVLNDEDEENLRSRLGVEFLEDELQSAMDEYWLVREFLERESSGEKK